MLVNVRLFAGAAQSVGSPKVYLEIEPTRSSVTVADVARQLVSNYPQLHELAARSRWALDDHFIALDFSVSEEQTLAMIPPVSGG